MKSACQVVKGKGRAANVVSPTSFHEIIQRKDAKKQRCAKKGVGEAIFPSIFANFLGKMCHILRTFPKFPNKLECASPFPPLFFAYLCPFAPLRLNFSITLAIFLGITLQGCKPTDPFIARATYQQIDGRDRSGPLYRARVPTGWERKDPAPGESLADTMKALCEFHFAEGGQSVRITIHNFPADNFDARIPPGAQVARWKRQFAALNPTDAVVVPQSHGGFAGLLLEATGTMDGKAMTMLGWSMQLAPEHYRVLMVLNDRYSRQMAADYTIKAIGDQELIKIKRDQIIDFANSFELVKEIPVRT